MYYSTNESLLDETSDTVTTTDDTFEYSVTLTRLMVGVTYYYKVMATNTDYTIESSTVGEFTTDESGKYSQL